MKKKYYQANNQLINQNIHTNTTLILTNHNSIKSNKNRQKI